MRYLYRVGVCVLVLNVGQNLWADQSIQKQIKIFGKGVSVSQDLSIIEDPIQDEISDSGVESVSQVSLFGKKIEIVKSSVKYRVSEDEGLSFHSEFYVKGKKVLAHGFINGDGSYAYEADVPYTETSGEVFSYSLGILSLGVHSGISYEGILKAEVSSELLKNEPYYALDMNLLQAAAEVDVMSKGFIEGRAKVLFVRGGVGGAVTLIDSQAEASISVDPDTIIDPVTAYGGVVKMLSGQFYGYVGTKRKKWHEGNFYKSKGYCHAFGESSCVN